ncbi:hypothetical protein CFC21_005793 [Triticum aestivum]|uniref:Uncharacterized protein n=3 Tax=Triticum TaxID=4564 RepID=A0A9R1DAI0_WHEAT|nr:hypothetical protein CFC21_005791 [Triticum aestivum]KAF6988226.1 hypothetical protein CFC21_005793 [Triticum aestivum]VAH14416.1 unnamed protein product [Triticum turgidum subsp. durum]
MIRTLVDIGDELVMVMSIVLLDWPTYVDVVCVPAHPWISAAGCLGSIGELMFSEFSIAATSVMAGRSAGSS